MASAGATDFLGDFIKKYEVTSDTVVTAVKLPWVTIGEDLQTMYKTKAALQTAIEKRIGMPSSGGSGGAAGGLPPSRSSSVAPASGRVAGGAAWSPGVSSIPEAPASSGGGGGGSVASPSTASSGGGGGSAWPPAASSGGGGGMFAPGWGSAAAAAAGGGGGAATAVDPFAGIYVGPEARVDTEAAAAAAVVAPPVNPFTAIVVYDPAVAVARLAAIRGENIAEATAASPAGQVPNIDTNYPIRAVLTALSTPLTATWYVSKVAVLGLLKLIDERNVENMRKVPSTALEAIRKGMEKPTYNYALLGEMRKQANLPEVKRTITDAGLLNLAITAFEMGEATTTAAYELLYSYNELMFMTPKSSTNTSTSGPGTVSPGMDMLPEHLRGFRCDLLRKYMIFVFYVRLKAVYRRQFAEQWASLPNTVKDQITDTSESKGALSRILNWLLSRKPQTGPALFRQGSIYTVGEHILKSLISRNEMYLVNGVINLFLSTNDPCGIDDIKTKFIAFLDPVEMDIPRIKDGQAPAFETYVRGTLEPVAQRSGLPNSYGIGGKAVSGPGGMSMGNLFTTGPARAKAAAAAERKAMANAAAADTKARANAAAAERNAMAKAAAEERNTIARGEGMLGALKPPSLLEKVAAGLGGVTGIMAGAPGAAVYGTGRGLYAAGSAVGKSAKDAWEGAKSAGGTFKGEFEREAKSTGNLLSEIGTVGAKLSRGAASRVSGLGAPNFTLSDAFVGVNRPPPPSTAAGGGGGAGVVDPYIHTLQRNAAAIRAAKAAAAKAAAAAAAAAGSGSGTSSLALPGIEFPGITEADRNAATAAKAAQRAATQVSRLAEVQEPGADEDEDEDDGAEDGGYGGGGGPLSDGGKVPGGPLVGEKRGRVPPKQGGGYRHTRRAAKRHSRRHRIVQRRKTRVNRKRVTRRR